MTTQVRRALPSPMAILSTNLDDLLALGDAEAAEALNSWMAALRRVEEVYAVSYGQRLVIIRHFEERSLWQYLIDPDTSLMFSTMNAWLSSGFIGCRRVNFEALRAGKLLADVPAHKLIDIPKGSLHALALLSPAVRADEAVLEAAKMGEDALLDKIEAEHPGQHLETRKPMRFSPGRSWAKTIEEAIAYALEHDIAGSRDEALLRMAETSLNDWQMDEEIKKEQAEAVTA